MHPEFHHSVTGLVKIALIQGLTKHQKLTVLQKPVNHFKTWFDRRMTLCCTISSTLQPVIPQCSSSVSTTHKIIKQNIPK